MRPLAQGLAAAFLLAGAGAAEEPDTSTAKTALYTVADGNRVDARTFAGWRTWRALACERCHGPSQEGRVGPSLIKALQVLSPVEFAATVMGGRPDKGMPSFAADRRMQDNWQGLYAYLKGRSAGDIPPGTLQPLETPGTP